MPTPTAVTPSVINTRHIVAIDLGASSGRVMLASYRSSPQQLELREVCRFVNQIKSIDGTDVWDIDTIEQSIRQGLNQLDSEGIQLDSIGIDSWGVDYVLLDKQGKRVGQPVSYRDSRTQGVMEQAQQCLGSSTIYRRTGIQFLPFNTLYQLRALSEQQPHLLADVAHLLLIPDYLHYRLTGQLNWEYTNASTTQLLNLETGDWDSDLLAYAGVPAHWFAKPSKPGNTIGYWQSASGQQVPVIAVASHDTASAVLAAPLVDADAAYLSSGTWSLMGFESLTPITHLQAQASNITNEGGAEGRYRVLKNIMGLWLLQRATDELQIKDLPHLIEQAACQPACRSLINPNDSRFINPANMCREIQNACREYGMPIPTTAAQLARCIFDSLAMLYRQVAQELAELRGYPISHLHIVGGGCQNQFLNQLCADACSLNVITGPVEASTLGNIGSQLIALGDVRDVAHYRRIVADNFPQHSLSPHDNADFAAHWPLFQSLSQQPKELCI